MTDQTPYRVQAGTTLVWFQPSPTANPTELGPDAQLVATALDAYNAQLVAGALNKALRDVPTLPLDWRDQVAKVARELPLSDRVRHEVTALLERWIST